MRPGGTGAAGCKRGGADAEVPGAVLFARYAYPPNALGYCGPDEAAAMLEMASGHGPVAELARLARLFEGAWPYLQLIAASNRIADPLDRRVVQAYWTGNRLLTRVPPAALARSVEEHFGARIGARPGLSVASPAAGLPQHSLHVFAVYPWLGMLRAGVEGAPLAVLDRCRVRLGRVVAADGDTVEVRVRPLVFTGSALRAGPARVEPARRSLGGAGLAGGLAPGDLVSLHWDWVCDRLSPHEARWLSACTRRNLEAVNGPPPSRQVRPPAVAPEGRPPSG